MGTTYAPSLGEVVDILARNFPTDAALNAFIRAIPDWGVKLADAAGHPENPGFTFEVADRLVRWGYWEAAAGRAAAMHQTSSAERGEHTALQLGGADWFRVAQAPIPEWRGLPVIGVEVVAGSPLLPSLVGNLDPQHGGGTFGLGAAHDPASVAACDAAMWIVRQRGAPLPPVVYRFATNRMDPDALVAAMILSGRIPLGVAQAALPLILELAELDSSAPVAGQTWRPSAEIEPQTVADHPTWGPVAALCLAYSRPAAGETPPTLADLEGAVWSALGGGAYPTTLYAAEAERHAQTLRRAAILPVSVQGPIAFGVDLPFGPGTWGALYCRAPIGVLSATQPGLPGARKYTIATHRAMTGTVEFHAAFRRLVGAVEPGWGGAETITGSPLKGGSALPLSQVLGFAQSAAIEAGVRGAGRR